MQELVTERRAGNNRDRVLLLEHEPVITLGRGAKLKHILKSSEELQALGVEVVETGRGGDVTLHAPGQLVVYPILALTKQKQDVRKYVKMLTHTMNLLLADYDLQGGEKDGLIGLWLDSENPHVWPGQEAVRLPEKVGAIGVRINRWVTSHGFALNFNTDLKLFQLIVPCGIQQHGVTSVQKIRGVTSKLKEKAEGVCKPMSDFMDRPPGPMQDLSAVSTQELKRYFLPDTP